MRRLGQGDEELLREAWNWTDTTPTWFQDADKVFASGKVDDLLAQLRDRDKWFIGVFDEGLSAVIAVERHGSGQFEGHLLARRRANPEMIALAIEQLLYDLLDCGLTEAFCWVAEKNLGVRKLCAKMEMKPDGFVMFKGAYRGRVIRWLRHSITRDQLLMAQAA